MHHLENHLVICTLRLKSLLLDILSQLTTLFPVLDCMRPPSLPPPSIRFVLHARP